MKNRRTLLIDLDPQGLSTLGLAKPKESAKGIYQAMMNGRDLMECIVGTELENFYLCPCSPELSGVEAELYASERREKRLVDAVEKARRYFNFILIDCPPSLGFLTINALSAADSLIIPVQTEFFCMEGIPDLFQTLETVRTYFNPKLAIEGILLTMFDERTNLSKQVAEEIRKSLKHILFDAIVPRSVRLAEAPSFGKPIVLYDIRSKGAEAYLNLAEEIIRR
jgi:chromosome partitioning protein